MLDAIASGALTLADIRGSAATRALLSEAGGTLPRVRHRPMMLRLEILQNAVDDLYRLGWLDGADHRVDAAVLDARHRFLNRRPIFGRLPVCALPDHRDISEACPVASSIAAS